jgi:lipopolysaccharide biosynthesis glycosyltransferase
MNCIFICVFYQTKYVEMFIILLESLLKYGGLDEKTHILLYTSTEFMNMIKKNSLFNEEKIKFEINDTYNNIDKACKARLDLFNLVAVHKYNKILYLDTDIIVKDNVNKLFDICKDDILYVLEEGKIDSDSDYWGKSLFGQEVNIYHDKSAFTSGIMLFNKCEKIKFLFDKINESIVNIRRLFSCYDQPYIVYNAFKYNLYNNKILKSFVVNNDNNTNSDKIIHHFPGGPGIYTNKLIKMTEFSNNLKKIK